MSDVHPVTITLSEKVRTFSANFQTETTFSSGWQSTLKAAYGKAELRCGCTGSGPKRLAVKYYEGSDQFSLARFSLSGGQHSIDCQFYSASPTQTGAGGGNSSVLDQQPDGSVKIRLEIGMVERDTPAELASPKRPQQERKPSTSQSSMKLLGLLHYLWDEAGLNQWMSGFAGKRRPSVAYRLINNATENVWAGTLKLVDQMLLPAFGADTQEADRNRERAAAALESKHRMLLIAPLAAFTQERADIMARQMKISGFHGMPIVYMKAGLWDTTVRRFKNELSAWRNGAGTVAIIQVELKKSSKSVYASAIDMAIMSITSEFIPVESSYERIIADRLVAQGRSFSKPLRFDSITDQVLPDFILTDTKREVPLEVFGRNDAAYLQRKREKEAYYDELYGRGGWWSWNASANSDAESVPPFPAAR